MKIIRLTETDSTNRYLMDYALREEEHEDMVVALTDYQSAGKGMGTNSWESEAGKNLLFSILLHPSYIPPRSQYLLSMAAALAYCDALKAIVGEGITIKWPNDIYYKDRKISGTLIQTRLGGQGIKDIVIGTGINVNQQSFVSDAPNPISLFQISGHEHSIYDLLDDIISRLRHFIHLLEYGQKVEVVQLYHQNLYRREGFHLYEDAYGCFEAEIVCVQEDGILSLRRKDGTASHYEFKEVRFKLNSEKQQKYDKIQKNTPQALG